MSIWVALERSSLYLDGVKHTFNAGDVVVFSGDLSHSGAENDSSEANFRLFAYVPTKTIPVPWEVKTGMDVKQAQVTDGKVIKILHKNTVPVSDNFDLETFKNHLFDFSKNSFYRFSTELWLGGLTTNTNSSTEPRYRDYVEGAPDLVVAGKCPHFDPRDFNADQRERGVLCDFRRQCVYCVGRKKKRARVSE